MRTPEEIKKIAEDVKNVFQKEFGTPYDYEYLKEGVDRMFAQRVDKFLYERIGHLRADDFMALNNLMEKPVAKKTKNS